MNWPHDDTNSLIAFYGDPRRSDFTSNLVLVSPPWQMTYEGRPIRGVQIHRKCADSLSAVFDDIAQQVGHDWSKLPPGAVKFSGSYNFRPIRGSTRLSCHAFGAAIDLDSEDNPMNSNGDLGTMSPIVVEAFERQGWYWGARFRGRLDPMHFQAANETSRVAEVVSDLSLVTSAAAAEMPPMTDGHAQSTIEEIPRPQAPLPPVAATVNPSLLHVENTNQLFGDLTSVPAWRSKIAWLTTALGGTSAASAISSDRNVSWVVGSLVQHPAFWVAIICLVLAGAVAYLHWRNPSAPRSW